VLTIKTKEMNAPIPKAGPALILPLTNTKAISNKKIKPKKTMSPPTEALTMFPSVETIEFESTIML